MGTPAASQRPAFVSLGMVVLDELRFPDRPSLHDVPGGSGAFSVLGARLVAEQERADQVGCFILAGNDFPESALRSFRSWGVNLDIQVDPARPSTRGLLEYKDSSFGRKTFRYTTTPLHPSPRDLPAHFLESASFHILALPSQLADHVRDLASLRPSAPVLDPPLLVWEPTPPYCSQQTKDEHMAACKHVDVFSPNHLELLAFFQEGKPVDGASHFDPKAIEACADAFLESGIGPSDKGTVVVRAGEHGCLVSSFTIEGRHRWLPAFYADAPSVVDATGGGNTFLGAFTYAMAACNKSPVDAAALANVAATFALEQIGTPTLEKVEGQRERWNSSEFDTRFQAYQQMLSR